MRKRFVISVPVVLLVVLAVLSPPVSPHVRTTSKRVDTSASVLSSVLRVVDGDTVDVEIALERVRVRLIGINTPETVDPRRPVECFGREASARMRAMLSGGAVRIETDPTQSRYDKYGRLLAYLYLPDGTSVNEQLIAEGYAYEYTYKVPYRFQSEFKAAEKSAREAGRGLWSPQACPKS